MPDDADISANCFGGGGGGGGGVVPDELPPPPPQDATIDATPSKIRARVCLVRRFIDFPT